MTGTISHGDDVVAGFDGQDTHCLNLCSLGVLLDYYAQWPYKLKTHFSDQNGFEQEKNRDF